MDDGRKESFYLSIFERGGCANLKKKTPTQNTNYTWADVLVSFSTNLFCIGKQFVMYDVICM